VFGAAEAVSREDALRMMTSAAAKFSFDEKSRRRHGANPTRRYGETKTVLFLRELRASVWAFLRASAPSANS
jgi:hypothetical protein